MSACEVCQEAEATWRFRTQIVGGVVRGDVCEACANDMAPMADSLTLIGAATTSALHDDLRDIVAHALYNSRAFRPERIGEAIMTITAQLEGVVEIMTAKGYVLVPADVRFDLESCAMAYRFTPAVGGEA